MRTMATRLFILALMLGSICLRAQTPKKITLQKFNSNDLPVIHTQKGFSTLIEFPEDKKIVEVTCGDKEFWVVEEGKGRFLHIKPAKEGIITNLNVLVEGDVVYAFLLKEISRTVDAKDGPDLRVNVNAVDELAKLRKEKEDLEEALSRSEHALKVLRALKELNDKSGSEDKPNPKKEDPTHWQHVEPLDDTPPSQPMSFAANRRSSAPPALLAVHAPLRIAFASYAPPSPPPVIASTYVIARKPGVLRRTGHALKRFFQKLNGAIHIY